MAEMASSKASIHPMLTPVQAMRMKKGKIISAEEAVRLIRDGDTIATEGFVEQDSRKRSSFSSKNTFRKRGVRGT